MIHGCRGDCRQGRMLCPHKGECQEDSLAVFVGLRNALLLTLAMVFVWWALSLWLVLS